MKNKILPISLAVILVISLALNGWLYYERITMQDTISMLEASIKSANDDIEQLKSQNGELSDKTEEQAKNFSELQEKYNKLSSDYLSSSAKLNHMECPHTISDEKVKDVTTNQALIEPITSAVEGDYRITSLSFPVS